MTLDPVLTIDVDCARPEQHVLVAGDSTEHSLAVIISACSNALRRGDRAVSVAAFYPPAGVVSYLRAFAAESGGRIELEIGTAERSLDNTTDRLICLVGLDEAAEALPFSGRYSPSPSDEQQPGDVLQKLLSAGHRDSALVLATAARPRKLRDVLPSGSIDAFGHRVGFGMHADDSMFVYGSSVAEGLDRRAMLMLPNGAEISYLPFVAPDTSGIQEFARVSA